MLLALKVAEGVTCQAVWARQGSRLSPGAARRNAALSTP